jgi:hypothetical protein
MGWVGFYRRTAVAAARRDELALITEPANATGPRNRCLVRRAGAGSSEAGDPVRRAFSEFRDERRHPVSGRCLPRLARSLSRLGELAGQGF